ncbi:unnamed protein product [Brassica oleracea var. botrytis]
MEPLMLEFERNMDFSPVRDKRDEGTSLNLMLGGLELRLIKVFILTILSYSRSRKDEQRNLDF